MHDAQKVGGFNAVKNLAEKRKLVGWANSALHQVTLVRVIPSHHVERANDVAARKAVVEHGYYVSMLIPGQKPDFIFEAASFVRRCSFLGEHFEGNWGLVDTYTAIYAPSATFSQ